MKKLKVSSEPAGDDSKSAGGAFISARLRNPAEEMASRPQGKGDVVCGIFAIVATVVLLLTGLLLYVNWDAIKSA